MGKLRQPKAHQDPRESSTDHLQEVAHKELGYRRKETGEEAELRVKRMM